MQPIMLKISCPHCKNSITAKIVTCELKNPENYLEGPSLIATYLCVGCQTIIEQEVKDFTL